MTDPAPVVTLDIAREILARRGGMLKSRSHRDDGTCAPCVRELRDLILRGGNRWFSDHPDGDSASPTDRACQRLNDAAWPTDDARTDGCLPLVLLTEATAAPDWWRAYAIATARLCVPLALRATRSASLAPHADACEAAQDIATVRAATTAARHAAEAAACADAAVDAATYATYATYAIYAADAADAASTVADAASTARLAALRLGVQILIACHQGRDAMSDAAVISARDEAYAACGLTAPKVGA